MTKPENPYLLDSAEGGSRITLRDVFAAAALVGFLSAPTDPDEVPTVGDCARECEETAARWAYEQADAMLAERAKKGGE